MTGCNRMPARQVIMLAGGECCGASEPGSSARE